MTDFVSREFFEQYVIEFHALPGAVPEVSETCLLVVAPDFDSSSLDASSELVKYMGLQGSVSLARNVMEKLKPSKDKGDSAEFMVEKGSSVYKFVFAKLPIAVSRNNTPARSHAVSDFVKKAKGSGDLTVLLVPATDDIAFAQAIACARPFPLYSDKSGTRKTREDLGFKKSRVNIVISSSGPSELFSDIALVASSLRSSQGLVDLPPNKLNCTTYVDYVIAKLKGKCGVKVICGEELNEQGFGGLYGVGKASPHPPALVILSHVPAGTEEKPSVCLVGKGIVFDTGGLSIKVPPGMCGMKSDMGGSAAVFGAFEALVNSGFKDCPVHALLCIAENSVDERAARPDDVHIMLSGKSVELNNTDAEGRLVLGDGVHYAAKHLKPACVVDIATLTGAQLVTTGRKHAGVFCSDDELEQISHDAGIKTGDLCFPMLYCPEFHREMFASQVADMKNSVSDRMNAQSSCAGQFIANHLEDYLDNGGRYLHIDMAGPSMADGRATGFGVALLYEITKALA